MLKLEVGTRVYLSLRSTDMRCGCDRLSRAVEEHFSRNSLDGALYVFLSRDRKKVKILQWEKDGYWLHYKRLETSTFQVKRRADGTEELTGVDLEALLSGTNLSRIKLSKKVKEQLSSKEAA